MSLKIWNFMIQQQENILLFSGENVQLCFYTKCFHFYNLWAWLIQFLWSDYNFLYLFRLSFDFNVLYICSLWKKFTFSTLYMILTLLFCSFWSCKMRTNKNVCLDGFKQSVCCLNAAADLQTLALCLFGAGLRPPIRPSNTSPVLSAVGSWASRFLYLLSRHSSGPSLYLGTFAWSQSSLVWRCHGAQRGTTALFGGWLAAWHIVPTVLIECQAPFYVHFTPPASLSLSVSQLVYPRRPLAERENTQIGESLE